MFYSVEITFNNGQIHLWKTNKNVVDIISGLRPTIKIDKIVIKKYIGNTIYRIDRL